MNHFISLFNEPPVKSDKMIVGKDAEGDNRGSL
jgi:hypothetical protein